MYKAEKKISLMINFARPFFFVFFCRGGEFYFILFYYFATHNELQAE